MQHHYQLIGAPTGNCIRAAIALEAAEIRYSLKRIDLQSGEQRSAAHLAINPHGEVPVLIDDSSSPGFLLHQSNAIVLYAAEHAPETLLAIDARARALIYERYFYMVTDVIALNYAAFQLSQLGFSRADAVMAQRAIDNAVMVERFLHSSKFIAGDHFTIADIAALTIVRAMQPDHQLDCLPKLARWLERVSQLPAVQRGIAAFG